MGEWRSVRPLFTVHRSLITHRRLPCGEQRTGLTKRPIFMSTPRFTLYDTTLRDGTQGTGISFSVVDKIRVAEKLDAFGVHYIEGGFPGSNPKDAEFFREVKKREWKHAKIAAFGATRRGKMRVEDDPQ